MIVQFRVDASPTIGYGHIVRSLSLAKALYKSERIEKIIFILNDYQETIELVKQEGFDVKIISDTYNEEEFLLSYFSNTQKSVIVFDNLFDYSIEFIKQLSSTHLTVMVHSYSESRFYCNLAIYPAAHLPTSFINDIKWTTAQTRLIFGVEYSLLNDEILALEPRSKINEKAQKIGFVAGGSDPSNSLLLFAEWLNTSNINNYQFFLFFGKGCNYKDRIQSITLKDNIQFSPFSPVKFEDIDLVICAFGVSVYELVYLNIPALTYGHSPKHAEASSRFAQKYNCTEDLGLILQLDKSYFIEKLLNVLEDARRRQFLFNNCVGLIDGDGVSRVSNEIVKIMK